VIESVAFPNVLCCTLTFFFICIVRVESKLGPLGTSAIYWPIVPAPGDCEDGEFGGMNGRGNQSSQRKPAPAPLCPPQIPLDQTRDWTQAAAVGSQWLTASAMAQPMYSGIAHILLPELMGYRCLSICVPHWQWWFSKTGAQLIVSSCKPDWLCEEIWCFQGPKQILLQQSVFTSFSFRINHRETAEFYGDTRKALEFKRRGFMWW
jgi:hypothetical protein